MWRYILRRLMWVIVVLLVITLITFVIFFVMPSVDPAVAFAGRQPTPEIVAEVKRQFGLDHPVWEQYLLFVRHLFLGDRYGWPGLGFSFASRSAIKPELFSRFLITAQLAVGAALVWLSIGIPIGVASAVRRRSLLDRAAMAFALFFVSMPVFLLGLLALWLLWFKWHLTPGTGYISVGTNFGSWLGHMILPWFVLAMLFAAFYARMTRGNLIETMAQDYIRTARVKGLPEWKVILKHGLRASLTPVVTMFGMDLGSLFGTAVVTESVFNLQGMGQWAIISVFAGDIPTVLAVVSVTAVAIALCNLIVDVLYAYLDPRVRYS